MYVCYVYVCVTGMCMCTICNLAMYEYNIPFFVDFLVFVSAGVRLFQLLRRPVSLGTPIDFDGTSLLMCSSRNIRGMVVGFFARKLFLISPEPWPEQPFDSSTTFTCVLKELINRLIKESRS